MNEFILVCVPDESQLGDLGVVPDNYAATPALIGGGRESPLFTLLKAGASGVDVLWPRPEKANGGTFFVYRSGTSDRLRVPSVSNARALRRRANADILLYLDPSPPGPRLLLSHDGQSRRFERGVIESSWFPTPTGAWVAEGSLSTRVFASVGGDAADGFTPVAVEDRQCEGEPVAVLNPIVLRVRLNGDELAPAGSDGGVTFASALRVLLDASANGVLLVEPVIPAAADPRIRALERLAEQVVRRNSRSVVEELLVGCHGGVGWLPFLCLDLLDGRFRLDHPAATPGGPWKSWGFLPEATVTGNAVWFAQYWLARWGGRFAPTDPAEAIVELPPDDRDPATREEFIDTGLRLTKAEHDTTQANCQDFLTRISDPTGFLAWAQPVLELLPPTTRHQQFVRKEKAKGGKYPISAKLDGLRQELGEFLLFPRSPVRVQPPPPAAVPASARPRYEAVVGGQLFDLRQSVRWCARDFAVRVTGAAAALPIRWRNGWWVAWYDQLFAPGAGPGFAFVTDDSGFVLDESRLGLDVLGDVGLYEQGNLMVI